MNYISITLLKHTHTKVQGLVISRLWASTRTQPGRDPPPQKAGGHLLHCCWKVWLRPHGHQGSAHTASLPAPAVLWSGSVPGYELGNLLTLVSVIPWTETQEERKGDSFSLSPTWFPSRLTVSSQACARPWKTARPDAGPGAKHSAEERAGRGCRSAWRPWQPP